MRASLFIAAAESDPEANEQGKLSNGENTFFFETQGIVV